MGDELNAGAYQWKTPTTCPHCGFTDTLRDGSCRLCNVKVVLADGGDRPSALLRTNRPYPSWDNFKYPGAYGLSVEGQ